MPLPTPPDPWPLPELQRARRAIVVVDVVESVRLMQEDESGFIDRWRRFVHEVRSDVLPAHGGRLVKSLGDGMLLEFERVAEGMAAALCLQELGRKRQLPIRIGAHVSEVVIDDVDVFGAGVNLAARVATLAEPGQVTVTSEVRDELVDGLDADLEDLGPCWLKHVDMPVHAFMVRPPSDPAATDSHQRPDISMTVAVMPLRCNVGQAEHAALGDLVADGLIARLSMASELKVVSRLSTRVVHERSLDAVQAGQQLGARYLLSGGFAVSGGRIVIDLEMADAEDGSVAWTKRVACRIEALFDQSCEPLDDLGSEAHRALLDSEARQVRTRPLPNLAAYTLLLGSIGLLHRTTTEDFDRARMALDTLVHREPQHGAGYTWLSKWHILRMIRGAAPSPQREREEAQRRADEALQRDHHNGIAWALRGVVHAYHGHDLVQAEAAYVRALDCNPSESLAWLYMATLRSWQGRGLEAVDAARRALELSPLDPMRYYFESLAAAAMLANNSYEDAISLAQRSLRVHRGHTPTYRVMTIAQALSGRMDDARATMALMRAIEPALTVNLYLERYPGREATHAHTYADALHAAGLPT